MNNKHGKWNHKGDGFREMIDIWKEKELVEVKEYRGNYCIWEENGRKILLYDQDNLEWYNKDKPKYEIGLFANSPPPLTNEINKIWSYWGRNPKQLESVHEILNYEERTIESIFIGKIENSVQWKYRQKYIEEFKDVIEKFDVILSMKDTYIYTQKEYLDLLSKSKYGLCMRGYGPKCHREIELYAMGVVPLLTNEVDTNYYVQPIENIHYFRINGPNDVKSIIDNTSKQKWKEMSLAGREWYEQNCSALGLFRTTSKIINNLINYEHKWSKPTSICTVCTNKCIDDLKLLLKSMEIFNNEIPIYLICDTLTYEYVHKNFLQLNIKCKINLDEFSDKSRVQLELEEKFTEMLQSKANVIDFCLETEIDTLFVDADMIFLDELPQIDTNSEIGLSPHQIKQKNIDLYGNFNAGMIYVKTKRFTKWWKERMKENTLFYEQGVLNEAPSVFNCFYFEENVNFGWWRLLESDNTLDSIQCFEIVDDVIYYKQRRLNSIHTHILENSNTLIYTFNNFIYNLIKKCKLQIYDFIYSELELVFPAGIVLCMQYYNDNDKKRQYEIDYCVTRNLENMKIHKVISFSEHETIIPDKFETNHKFTNILVTGRLTYNDVLKYANINLKDKFICICNADIFLDDKCDWMQMYREMRRDRKIIFTLSRHEYNGLTNTKDTELNKLGYATSQDAWFFIPKVDLKNVDIVIGTLGCDNAFAKEIKNSNYIPINSPNKYKILHYDKCRNKNGTNFKDFSKKYEQNKGIINNNLQEHSYYLCPDIDKFNNIEYLVNNILHLNRYQKYEIVCDILSKYIKVKN